MQIHALVIGLRRIATAKRHQRLHDAADASRLLQDLLDRLADQCGAILRTQILCQASDAGDRVADLVGDTGG